MRAKFEQWIYRLQGSYWFVPALMAIAAIVLSQSTIHLDRNVGADWMTDSWWASLNQPEGARALLATVAGSMITVTGVTFSLTILAVSYATSHFGPRLLDNFMRDRGNQVTLGTFVATFLYCLLVLRTVRSQSDGETGFQTEIFVPHVSVLIAIGLTLASVGVLIYFIHHIPESIHISNVLDRISQQLTDKVADLYPERIGEPAKRPSEQTLKDIRGGQRVRSKWSGYLQGIDQTALLEFAKDRNATAELFVRPGDYLLEGQHIATIKFHDDEDSNCDDENTDRESECTSRVMGSLAIGVARTPTQDIHFLSNQYVEIAARALSPGVNDPFTAIQCIDGLSKMLVELSGRSLPSRYREDDDGHLRVITTKPSWADLLDGALRQLLPYVKTDPNVTAYLRQVICKVCEISTNAELNRELEYVAAELEK